MAKFSTGDRVRALQRDRWHSKYELGTVDEDNSACLFVVWDSGNTSVAFEGNLELIERKEKTMEDLQKGDVIYDKEGDAYTVLARLEDIVWLSEYNNPKRIFNYYLISDLEDNDFYLKTEPTEMTVAEVEEKLGYPVKIIRGKKK